MEVCDRCHESDKRMIKCITPLIHHISWYRGFVGACDICGKMVGTTYTCVAYDKYLKKLEKNNVRLRKMP